MMEGVEMETSEGLRQFPRTKDELVESQYGALGALNLAWRKSFVKQLAPFVEKYPSLHSSQPPIGQLTVISARSAFTIHHLMRKGWYNPRPWKRLWIAGEYPEDDIDDDRTTDRYTTASEFILLQLSSDPDWANQFSSIQILDDMRLHDRKLHRLQNLIENLEDVGKHIKIDSSAALDFTDLALHDLYKGQEAEAKSKELQEIKDELSKDPDNEEAVAKFNKFTEENSELWSKAWTDCSNAHRQLDLCCAANLTPLVSRSPISEPMRLTDEQYEQLMCDSGWQVVDITRPFVAGGDYRDYRLLPEKKFADCCIKALDEVSPDIKTYIADLSIHLSAAMRGIDESGDLIYDVVFSPIVRLLPIAGDGVKQWMIQQLKVVPSGNQAVEDAQVIEAYLLFSYFLADVINDALSKYLRSSFNICLMNDERFSSRLLGSLKKYLVKETQNGTKAARNGILARSKFVVSVSGGSHCWNPKTFRDIFDLDEDDKNLCAIGDETNGVDVYRHLLGDFTDQPESSGTKSRGLLHRQMKDSCLIYELLGKHPKWDADETPSLQDLGISEEALWLHLAVLEMGGFAVPDAKLDDTGVYIGEVDLRGESVSPTDKYMTGKFASLPYTWFGKWNPFEDQEEEG